MRKWYRKAAALLGLIVLWFLFIDGIYDFVSNGPTFHNCIVILFAGIAAVCYSIRQLRVSKAIRKRSRKVPPVHEKRSF